MRKRRRKARSQPKNKLLIWVFFILVLLGGYLFIVFNTRFWNGEDKVATVIQKGNGDTEVVLLDPKLEEVITFVIPADTEVNVARNLGTMRLKNVWQLGVNEGLGGSLVAQTVTHNFLFPVSLWEDINGTTNIPVGDRLQLKIFNFKTKNLNKTQINLGESQFLKREVLVDGELGFKLYGETSSRLTAYFADDNFDNKKIYIKDATNTFGVAENVGRILEVMGGKVTTLEKLPAEETECTVSGTDKNVVSKVSRLFTCKIEKSDTDFDLELRLGQDFAKRF